MKKTFNFGRINYTGTGKRYPVTVDVELRNRGGEEIFRIDPKTRERIYTGETAPEYVEFSAMGMIGARCGGQCLDEINKHRRDMKPSDRAVWDEIYKFWKLYHLNGMHAGTPEQEAAIEKWEADGNRYEYNAVCEYLKAAGLYEVNYTGLSIGRRLENEPYRYGSRWLIQEIPGDDLLRIEHLLTA